MNIVRVTGTVQKDVIVREFVNAKGGGKIANIRLGIGNGRGSFVYISVLVWNEEAEAVEGLAEGAKVEVHGRLSRGRDWTDRNNVLQRGDIEIVAEAVIVLDQKTGEPSRIEDGNQSVESIKFS